MSKDYPTVRIDFLFIGDTIHFDSITEKLEIVPTKTRAKEDFKVQTVAQAYWCLSTEDSKCRAVKWRLKELQDILLNKADIINAICAEQNLHTYFNVSIWMYSAETPEIVLTPDNIQFLSSINAEIGFDIYAYDD